MVGFHIYRKTKESGKYSPIDKIVLLNSILHYKRLFGEIHLICNTEYAMELSESGLLELYDSVNVNLSSLYDAMDLPKHYWSAFKIFALSNICYKPTDFGLEMDSDICVLDTDLYFRSTDSLIIRDRIKFPGITLFHKELIDISANNDKSAYPNIDSWLEFLSEFNLDPQTSPHNCAIIKLNLDYHRSAVLLWWNMALNFIHRNMELKSYDINAHTIFIEQRLFPCILKNQGIQLNTYLDKDFITGIEVDINSPTGEEWSPRPGENPISDMISKSVVHIWGVKQLYHQPIVGNSVIYGSIKDLMTLHNYQRRYAGLIKDCLTLIQL